MKNKYDVLIIDALNLFIRNYTVSPLMSAKGQQVGGTVGFIRSLKLLIEKFNPSEVIVVWEGGGSTRRRGVFKDYKSGSKPRKLNRFYEQDEIPDSLSNRNYQIQLTIEFLNCLSINQIYVDNCEADDVIGYVSQYNRINESILIVSSDKDYYQLVNDRVHQWSPGQKKVLTPESILEKTKIPTYNFCLAKAIVGDKSDNLDGVKGVGFKVLAKVIPDIITTELMLDDVFELAKKYKQDRTLKAYDNIIQSEDLIRRNWKLMFLGVANLSASHIDKINQAIINYDESKPKRDKLKMYRIAIREKLNMIPSFDIDGIFMISKACIQ